MDMKENPKITLESVDILEYNNRPYVNKKGESVTFTELLVRFGGKVMKFPCDNKIDFASVVNKSVKLEVQFETWGDNLTPSLRAMSVVTKA